METGSLISFFEFGYKFTQCSLELLSQELFVNSTCKFGAYSAILAETINYLLKMRKCYLREHVNTKFQRHWQ